MKLIKQFLQEHWAILVIVILASILRVWGINFGLPYTYAPDEPSRMNVALGIVRTGDLDPHWLGYPHLAFYLNALAFLIYFLIGRFAGVFTSPADLSYPQVITIGVGKLELPSEYLIGRGVTALVSIGAVILVYLIARQISKRKQVAIVASLLFAVSPAAVIHSKFISLDAFGVFFSLLALYWINAWIDSPTLANYFWAGAGVGLAFSGKYNDGVIALALAVALWTRLGWRKLINRGTGLAFVGGLVAFAITNPFSILNLQGFFDGLSMASGSQSQYMGTANGFVWYSQYLVTIEGFAVVLALGQLIRILRQPTPKGLTLVTFPIAYFVFVSMFPVHNDRTILPIIPFIDLLAVWFIVDVSWEWISVPRLSSRFVQIGAGVVLTVLIVPPFSYTLNYDWRITQNDSRETARVWLAANLPANARVALEGYSTYVDPQQFTVSGIDSIPSHPLEWYSANGFEYLVFSQGIYGRFFDEPLGYADLIKKYNDFFQRLELVKQFNDNGYEIRVYKTNVILPPHRVAARFGDDGELVELVGFDYGDWKSGTPLNLKLTWRTLTNQPEPFEIKLRLLDDTDREIAALQSDLFQGAGWRSGMFDGTWRFPASANLVPGHYRVQVNLTWTRFNYHLPARSWTGEEISPVLLPIEFK